MFNHKVLLLVLVIVLACTASVAAAQDCLVPKNVEKIFPYTLHGDRTRATAYAEAMQFALQGKLAPYQLELYSTSMKLAAHQQETNHQKVLVAMAMGWEQDGLRNPVSVAMGYVLERPAAMSISVPRKTLLAMYQKVLFEQGLIARDEKDISLSELLQDSYR